MKDDDKEKLRVFLHEYDTAREEINNSIKQQIRAFFAFMTLSGGALIIVIKPEVFQEYIRGDLFIFWLFFIGQIEFAIALVAISQYSLVAMRAGQTRAIEKRINNLFNAQLVIWESEIAKHWIWNGRSSFFWAVVVLGIFLGGMFAIITVKVISEHTVYGTVMVLELILLLLLVVLTYMHANKVAAFAERILSAGESQFNKGKGNSN